MPSRLMLAFWVVAGCLMVPGVNAAEVYRWTDADGVTHFSDSEPPAGAEAMDLREALLVGSEATPPPRARPPSIVMYMSPTCGYCIRADRYFKERGLRYRSIDITASEENYQAFRRRGGTGTPLLIIDGETVRGFSAERLDRLLSNR